MPTETSAEPTPVQLAAALRDTVIGWRRHLHMHPELSFHEEQTAQFVYETLSGFAGLHPGPVLAIRADMDALPILEKNDMEYASRTPGVMHACGHDGHTAMLLGAAKILAAHREWLHGEVRF